MARKLTQASKDTLDAKHVMTYEYLEIDAVQIPAEDILSYDYNMDRSFGAARFSVTLKNDGGTYDSIDFNDSVVFKEGLRGFDDTIETIPKFYGLVRQTDFQRKSGGTKAITITALDLICRLQDLEYEQKHEATKIYVTDEILTAASGQDGTQCRVLDSENTNWATFPIPSIRVEKQMEDDLSARWDGFEINYQGGQVVLSLALNVDDNYDIKATYAYYKDGVYVEDVIKDLITAQDGYGNTVFSDATDLTDSFLNVKGGVGDDDVNRGATLTIATSGGDATINIADNSNFDTSGTGYIDNGDGTYDEFTYTAKSGPTQLTGCSGVLAHALGTEVYQVRDYLLPNLVPATIDRSATLSGDLSSSATTVPVKPVTNSMLPNSDISEWDGNVLKYYDWDDNWGLYKGDSNGVTFSGDGSTATWGLVHFGDLASNMKIGDRYLLSIEAKYSGTAPSQGQLNMDLFGTAVDTTGVQVNCSTLTTGYVRYTSSNFTLSSVPSDLECRIFVSGTLTNNSVVHIKDWILEKVADSTITTASEFWKANTFDSSGHVKINDEYIQYTSRDKDSFNSCTRAALSSTAVAHDANATVTQVYPAGQVWWLTFNNHSTSLVSGDFYLSTGSIADIDKRYGLVVMTAAISTSATVYSKKNYDFCTIQATGVELGSVEFTYRDIASRFDAIGKLRELVSPSYMLMTKGSAKIWGNYLKQKVSEDFELQLVKSLSHAQDVDLYTRVKLWGKNSNPTNILVEDEGVSVSSSEDWSGTASKVELEKVNEEEDWFIFRPSIYNEELRFLDTPTPMVYINGVPMDDTPHQVVNQPVVVEEGKMTKYKTSGSVTTTYDTYVIFAHGWIVPDVQIVLNDQYGAAITIISANDDNVDYVGGWWGVPGTMKDHELVGGPYHIRADDKYLSSLFVQKTDSSLAYILDPDAGWLGTGLAAGQIARVYVKGQGYDYVSYYTIDNVTASNLYIVAEEDWPDGWFADTSTAWTDARTTVRGYIPGILDASTATYTVNMYEEPEDEESGKPGASLLIIDTEKAEFRIRSDVLYQPGDNDDPNADLRIDLVQATFGFSNASLDSIDMDDLAFAIDGRPDTQFQMTFSAEPVQGTELFIIDMGEQKEVDAIDITAGYFLPNEYEGDPSRYGSTNYFTVQYSTNGTSYFDIAQGTTYFRLESGESVQFESDVLGESFSCRYLKIILDRSDKIDYKDGIWVFALQEIAVYRDVILKSEAILVATAAEVTESPPTIYDSDGLLSTVGDRVWKDSRINEDLNTQEKIDRRTREYLAELYKNHTKAGVDVAYDPRPMVGDTVKTIDHTGASTNYFLESISRQSRGNLQLTLARYP